MIPVSGDVVPMAFVLASAAPICHVHLVGLAMATCAPSLIQELYVKTTAPAWAGGARMGYVHVTVTLLRHALPDGSVMWPSSNVYSEALDSCVSKTVNVALAHV